MSLRSSPPPPVHRRALSTIRPYCQARSHRRSGAVPALSLFDEGKSGLFSSNASVSLCLILFPLFYASPAMPGVLGRHPDCPRLYTLHSSYPLLIVPNAMSSPTLPLAFPSKSPSLNRLYADCVFGRLQLQHFRRIDDTTLQLTRILG